MRVETTIRLPKGLNKILPIHGDILRIILSGLEGHGFDELSPSFPASDNLIAWWESPLYLFQQIALRCGSVVSWVKQRSVYCRWEETEGCPGCVSSNWSRISKCLLGHSHLRNTLVVLRVVIEVWPPRLLWDRRRWKVSASHRDWWAKPEGGTRVLLQWGSVCETTTNGCSEDRPSPGNYLGGRDQGQMLGARKADHLPPFHLIITLFFVSFQCIE